MTARIVAFDLGGVLVRVAYTWGEAARQAGIQLSKPDSAHQRLSATPEFEAYQARQIGLQEFLQALRSDLGLADVEEALRLHQGILMDPMPGTHELVQDLEAAGLRTGCLSNTNGAHWTYLRDPGHYPAIARLQVPVASHEVGLAKPDPAIYRKFEEISGCAPDEILFFDDLQENVDAARASGWQAMRVDPAQDTAAQMRGHLRAALQRTA